MESQIFIPLFIRNIFFNYINSTCPMSLLPNRSVYRSTERVLYFVSTFSFEIPTNFLGNVHLLEAGYYCFNDVYLTRRLDVLSERHWLTYWSLSLAHWLQIATDTHTIDFHSPHHRAVAWSTKMVYTIWLISERHVGSCLSTSCTFI